MRKLWESDNWQQCLQNISKDRISGLRTRFAEGIDPEIRRASIEFCRWLRKNYEFPIRVIIYFKKEEYVLTKEGLRSSAIFSSPYDKSREPHIKIATGDLKEIALDCGEENALGALLCTIAHELSHYYQWLKDYDLTSSKCERQARYYGLEISYDYADTRDYL